MHATKIKSAPSISGQPEHDTAKTVTSIAPHKRKRRFSPKPEFIPIAKEMCQLGATNAVLAAAFNVSLDTIALWQSTDRGFSNACQTGTDAAANRVTRAIYECAVGYDYQVDTVVRNRDGLSIVQRNVHVPADPRAGKLWREGREAELALTKESPVRQFALQLMGTAIRPKPQQ